MSRRIANPLWANHPWPILKATFANWLSDQASSIRAALAFYSAFSLAPLLVIAVAAIGWIVGAEAADAHIGAQLEELFGGSTAKMIVETMHSSQKAQGNWSTIVSIVTLVITFGAAASFAALLLWLYYSAQIFLFGAEFTAVIGGTRVDRNVTNRVVPSGAAGGG